ncbi:MAG: hypothetical protein JKY65_29640 [Planctomycetes bacterium]|nr:hypothetical protein [Planctomycetota bacterium]
MIVAALSCRAGAEGLEVLLVTSRLDGSWEIPAGSDQDSAPHAAVARLAFETSGVRGRVAEDAWGHCTSRRGSRSVAIYLLKVEREVEFFPERGKRRREWVSLAEAQSRLAHSPDLAVLVGSVRLESLPPTISLGDGPSLWERTRGDSPVVCLDLDDTILGRGDEPLPGAVAACEVLVERGCRLVASTARLDPIWAGSPREGKVREVLARCGFPIEEVFVEVPSADLYVDDKGWRFRGDWEELADVVAGRLGRERRPRVSLALAGALMNSDEGPTPGASQALKRLRQGRVEVIASLGNFRPAGASLGERLAQAKIWLAEHGLEVDRVHQGKISSGLYVDSHAVPFHGDWRATLPEVLRRLRRGQGIT